MHRLQYNAVELGETSRSLWSSTVYLSMVLLPIIKFSWITNDVELVFFFFALRHVINSPLPILFQGTVIEINNKLKARGVGAINVSHNKQTFELFIYFLTCRDNALDIWKGEKKCFKTPVPCFKYLPSQANRFV